MTTLQAYTETTKRLAEADQLPKSMVCKRTTRRLPILMTTSGICASCIRRWHAIPYAGRFQHLRKQALCSDQQAMRVNYLSYVKLVQCLRP